MAYASFVGINQHHPVISTIANKAELFCTKYMPEALRHVGLIGNSYLTITGLKEVFYNKARHRFTINPYPRINLQALFSNQHYYLVHGLANTLAGGFGIFLNMHDYQLLDAGKAYLSLSVVAGGFFIFANTLTFHHYRKIYRFVKERHGTLDETGQKGNNSLRYSTIMGLIGCVSYFMQAFVCIIGFPTVGLGFGVFALSVGLTKFFYDIAFVASFELSEQIL